MSNIHPGTPQPRPRASVDGILRPRTGTRPKQRRTPPLPHLQPLGSQRSWPVETPAPPVHAKPQPQAPARHKAKPSRKRHSFRTVLRLMLQATAVIVLLLLGLFSRYAVIGQVVIGLYGVAALVMRLESRTSFTLAVMALAVVLVASLRADTVLAGAFAIYAFLLLAIGAISLGREIHNA
ncbi:MAG TPA: hypothetical protein VK674_07105 [Candidatus Limnocylindria bacterium]|nr:hypothetical protein [Candidatus Limnocylindria bacterium]